MSSTADAGEEPVTPSDRDGRDERGAVFAGDRGLLSVDTRRVLVQLLLGPAMDARRQTKLWPVLLREEDVIRSRLHELFLDLVIDHEQKVAFTRQVSEEGVDIPVLLRRTNLTFLESALLLHLRQRLTQADVQGERAVISHDEMVVHLGVFERKGNADHARFSRLVQNAIDKGKKLSLLQKVRGTNDRYEVSPTLKLLFSAEEIQVLTRAYVGLTAGEVSVAEENADDDSDGVAVE
ncbi:MAG TPA: DUF4194 domain-containing protein [Polyangia bacterium]|nr:DUF4194 domain-containing protein [Polyangia bacterium]